MTKTKDNEFLYLIKLIASLFVITIHAPFPGFFGDVVGSISRFAVPFFFAISGRFLFAGCCTSSEGDWREIRSVTLARLMKLLKVTAVVYLVHTVFSLVVNLIQGMTFGEWISMKYNAGEAFTFFLFNSGRFIYDNSYVFDHLWYLFALIYVYLLIIIFAPLLKKLQRFLLTVLMLGLFFGQWLRIYYPIRPFDISIHTPYMLRNWLLFGMPFVLLGIVYADHIGSLRAKLSDEAFAEKIRRFGFIGTVLVATGLILGFAEQAVFGSQEIYIGSIFIVCGVMLIAEGKPSCGRFLWKLGKIGSSNIYFYHVLLIAVLDLLSQNGYIPQYTMGQKPVIVMALSLVLFAVIPFFIKKGYLDEQRAVS